MESLNEFLSHPLGMIAAAALALLAGSLVFNAKQFEAHWKQWAIDTAGAMSKAGLVHTPKILNALAVGDLPGAFREIKNLHAIFTDPAQLKAEFATVFHNMLQDALKDPNESKALQQLATDAVAAFASGNPIASVDQLTTDASALASASPLAGISHSPSMMAALFPPLASNPALAAVASALSQAGLSHLIPMLSAAAGQPAANTSSTPPPAAGLTVTASGMQPGHVITASATPGSPAAASSP